MQTHMYKTLTWMEDYHVLHNVDKTTCRHALYLAHLCIQLFSLILPVTVHALAVEPEQYRCTCKFMLLTWIASTHKQFLSR